MDIKFFALIDSSTLYVYINKITVYSGKQHSFNKKFGLHYLMVLKLLEGLENKGHIIFFDNYYSSIKLFEVLAETNFEFQEHGIRIEEVFQLQLEKNLLKKEM